MGVFDRDEFLRGVSKGLDKERWKEELVLDSKRVYEFTGIFARAAGCDYIDCATAREYWRLFSAYWTFPMVPKLLEWADKQPDNMKITKDAWNVTSAP
ncbi:cullin-binding domain protein [Gregarina niphandrodes]|uniref:Cullin-binding domain protein n=1 Tax=Gregarina niphandrodes TaxID=110365 RepID=A0A023B051_GRENI|nr:cullin-binding domain protein [Gregarina niphandrodes]EZG43950.1 cullin-binding domain protein [Gregarina niphandrodes]|eukprot:XP_011132881.1 cullin-binding domain protein [Gregarina niphandrodes]